MTPNILVLVYAPDSPAQPQMIANELDAMQKVVGGYLEVVRLPVPDLVLVCNEEGLLLDLPVNRMGLRGTFFVTRCDPNGDFVSLTDDDTLLVQQLLSKTVQKIDLLH